MMVRRLGRSIDLTEASILADRLVLAKRDVVMAKGAVLGEEFNEATATLDNIAVQLDAVIGALRGARPVPPPVLGAA